MAASGFPDSAARSPAAAKGLVCLFLAIMLAMTSGVATATADPLAGVPEPGASDSTKPSSDYPVKLNERIERNAKRRSELEQSGKPLAARRESIHEKRQSLDKRMDDHNAKVASYPNREAPAQIADAMNAEAQALNSERGSLNAEIDAYNTDLSAYVNGLREVEGEALAIIREVDHVWQAWLDTWPKPLVIRQVPGVDSVRPKGGLNRGPDGKYRSGNGGDRVATGRERAALDAYERDHGVTVIKGQVHAYLTSETRGKLSPADEAKLNKYRKFDGLVLLPNGHYRGIEVKTAGTGLEAPQRIFDEAIKFHGGQAYTYLNGKKVVIDEVHLLAG